MEIRVGNRIAEGELISKVGNCVRMSIDGKVLDLDVMMAENGVCSILMDGVSYNAELIRAEGGKSYTVNTAFASLPVEILDAKAKLLSARRKEGERQEDRIVALMPGKVVKVMAAEGDRLAAGDTVLVIEAMKMETNIIAREGGVVERIYVSEGQQVKAGEMVAKLK